MEKVQFEYFVAANWNTLFEGGSIGGRRGGAGGALPIFGHQSIQPAFLLWKSVKNLPPSHSVPFKI